MPEQIEYGTSHISIVDAHGNALAMTTTIEDQFGSRQMVKGFLLNNELTDFSMAPKAGQRLLIAEPRTTRQAPALVHGPHAGVRQSHRPTGDEYWQPRRRTNHHYTRQNPARRAGLGANAAAGHQYLPNFSSLNGPQPARSPALSPPPRP